MVKILHDHNSKSIQFTEFSCPSCSSGNIVLHQGRYICKECGHLIQLTEVEISDD